MAAVARLIALQSMKFPDISTASAPRAQLMRMEAFSPPLPPQFSIILPVTSIRDAPSIRMPTPLKPTT